MPLSDEALALGAAKVVTNGGQLGVAAVLSFKITRQGDAIPLFQGTIKRAPRSPKQDSTRRPAHQGGQASSVMLTRLFTLGSSHQPPFSGSPRALLPRSFSRAPGRSSAFRPPPPESASSAPSVSWDDGSSYQGLSFPVCIKEVERAQSLKESESLLSLC